MLVVFLILLLFVSFTMGINIDTGLKVPVYVGAVVFLVVYALIQIF